MENKLTWVELKKEVARQTDLTEKEVNLILTIWLDEMAAALHRGEELHIGGLGTFKMKTMKARKSVNVTTGEAIILPETDRLTYTMATSLEQQLSDNTPARMEIGQDPIKKLSDQADEIMDIIGEIKAIGDRRQGEKAKEPEGQKAIGDRRQGKKKKKERLWLTALITIVAFVVLLFGLFFFFQHKFEQWLQQLRVEAEMVEQVEQVDPKSEPENLDTLEDLETLENPETLEIPNHRTYTEFITTEEMHQDSRLAWMAYRYYGNKKLWVFIYDANKDHIAQPEHVPVGTPVRVPKLSKEILDFDEDIQLLVQQMYDEFLHK